MDSKKISELFSKFAGKSLEGAFSHEGSPVVAEMAEVAKNNGLKLRIIFGVPADRHDLSSPPDRVTVYANRKYDGSFYVSSFKQG